VIHRLVAAVALLPLACVAWAAEPLKAGTVEYRDVEAAYSADGVIEAVKQSTVAAQVTGRIIEIRFDVGDYVKKGQVIVRLDPRDADETLAASRAQYAQAQANFVHARANYERTRQLFAQKFVSQAALDKAEAEYRAAQAQSDAMQAGVARAETARGFATIIAPYSGVVSVRHIELGELATPGKPLMTGFDPTDMRVVANVPQHDVEAVRKASSVIVDVPALNRSVKATGITVLPTADPKTHTTRVRIDLPPSRDIYPGMFARAKFVIGHERKLIIPAQTVLKRSELTAVYVIDRDDRPHLRQVKLGEAVNPGEIEVLAGLTAGERIALEPVKVGIAMKQGGK
jgi:membrane fusion protein, multidrug efflux system